MRTSELLFMCTRRVIITKMLWESLSRALSPPSAFRQRGKQGADRRKRERRRDAGQGRRRLVGHAEGTSRQSSRIELSLERSPEARKHEWEKCAAPSPRPAPQEPDGQKIRFSKEEKTFRFLHKRIIRIYAESPLQKCCAGLSESPKILGITSYLFMILPINKKESPQKGLFWLSALLDSCVLKRNVTDSTP